MLQWEVILDVYLPDMEEADWFEYKLNIIIADCSVEKGILLKILSKNGTEYKEDMPV